MVVVVVQTSEVNQGNNLEHDFTCLLTVLMFPVKHLYLLPLTEVISYYDYYYYYDYCYYYYYYYYYYDYCYYTMAETKTKTSTTTTTNITTMTATGATTLMPSWLRSYLVDRAQFIKMGQHQSDTVALDVGVPQGSVLGPLLFAVYCSPVGDVIHHATQRQVPPVC